MRRGECLWIACAACSVLAVASYVEVPGQINSFASDSSYWQCDSWPKLLQSQSVQYQGGREPDDDAAFWWICPARCKSMPYFDIKTSVSFMVWEYDRTANQKGSSIDFYKTKKKEASYWTGNKAYRDGYDQSMLTNSPSFTGRLASANSIEWGEVAALSTTLVKSVGDCKKEVTTGNVAAENLACSNVKPGHLATVFAATMYTSDVLDYTYQLTPCLFEDAKVNTYTWSCSQPARPDIISVKPSYVFFPTATGKTGKEGICQVKNYKSTATTALATREASTRDAWDTAPRYSKHTYALTKLPFEYTEEWYVDYLGTNIAEYEQDISFPTGETPTRGKIKEGSLKTRKYEWQCKNWVCPWDQWATGKSCWLEYSYFAAKNYESKCSNELCESFVTPACWTNVYAIAALPCAWQQRVKDSSATDGFVNLDQMTSVDYAKSMQEYGGGTFEVAIPASMTASKRTAAGDVTAMGNGKVPIAATDKLRIALKDTHSCALCVEAQSIRPGVWGVLATTVRKELQVVVECKLCAAYEYVKDYVCTACEVHRVRAREVRSYCVDCPKDTPMRRAGGQDASCRECQILDYFDGADPIGCVRLASVMNGRTAAEIKGVDEYYSEGKPRAIMPKKYRVVQAQTGWLDAVLESPCAYTTYAVARATELSFRRWCGHREIVREQQALLAVGNASYLYRADNTTAGFAAIGDVCGATLQATTSGLFDLTCTDNRSTAVSISVVRSGHPQKCAVCRGSQYTRQCWPTYLPDLASEEAAYFQSTERLSSPGTCAQCAGQCLLPNQYMQPAPFTCMWNGSADGRVLGVVSALPSTGLWYWYKQAPCTPCLDVNLNTTHAMLHKQCGNKRTYRTWDALQTVPQEFRSIPLTQTCCSTKKAAAEKECTESEHSSWIDENCKDALELEDVAPVKETYCPPGWYVDQVCAEGTPAAWAPDCCKRCGGCSGGMFRTESYVTCTGATYIDTEQNGCEQSCLSNSYKKDGNCYRCESCSTTGTGEHGRESV